MLRSIWIKRNVIAILILASAGSAPAFGQTTLINIPTADTLPRRAINIEADFIIKPAPYRDGGYQTYGYRMAYGVTDSTEIGSNFYYTYDGSNSSQQVEFSLKQRIYNNEPLGLTVSGGAVAFVPIKSDIGDKTAVIFYGVAGKTIKKLSGLTVSGGGYTIAGGSDDFGTRSGVIVGVSQPVTSRVSFVADWYSGKNRLGYASAGFNWAISNRQYLTGAYSFGNSGRGNNSVAAYYGFIF